MSQGRKVVLITGANQGLGYETAKNLVSSADYHVILGSRDSAKGEAASKELQSVAGIKGTVSSLQLDVTDDNSVDAAAQRVEAEWGALDILVNNAGIVSATSPPSREALRSVLETNVVGALSVIEAFLPLLRKAAHQPARLVFVSSSMGSITHAADPSSPYYNANNTEYRVSKAALNMLMIIYNAQLKSETILVFGADPGLCATNFVQDPAYLKSRGAAKPSEGGDRVVTVVKGEKDADAGKVLGTYGISPW